jgi:hypothetical protein
LDAIYRLCPIFLVLVLSGCGDGDHRVLEEVIERTYSFEPGATVTVQNRDGAILVYGSDDSDIRVQCVKKAYRQERLDQMEIAVSQKPGAFSVVAKFPPRRKWAFFDQSGTMDCTIVVPATAGISTVELDAGEVVLDSMHGPEVHARLGDGRVFARNCSTNLDLRLNRGTITFGYDWWEQAAFSAQVSVGQGNVWMFLPTDSALHLLADVAYGKIVNDFDVPMNASSSVAEKKIDQIINGGGLVTIEVRVNNGNIKIAEANP